MSLATGANHSSRLTGGKDIIPRGFSKARIGQFTPEQTQLYGSLYSHLGPDSYMSRLAAGDPALFQDIEEQSLRDLGTAQGQAASRFSGMGLGGRHSSGHALAQGQLAKDFASDLRAQRMGLQRQAIMDLHGLANSLLAQRPYEQSLVPKKKPAWQTFLESIIPGIGQGIGSFGSMGLGKKLGLTGQ